ncbi:MAG TPA: serine/threonine-protein kinase, partial [Kofleriaceae bacterium]|nr:serine/threonine-protein kinase [Kofleriaceae bacterium]
MSDSSHSLDNDATMPGGLGVRASEGEADAPAADAPAADAPAEPAVDDAPTLRKPRTLFGLDQVPTAPAALAPAANQAWPFGEGSTLDAESSSVAHASSSALDALLKDIEQSFAGAAKAVRPGPLIGHANRFQLSARLGHGGMGVVFKAFDHELRRYVAVKLLAPSQLGLSEDRIDHFLRNEARAIAALGHPSIVQVFDISSWCEVPFLVMEYLEGHSLDELPAEPMPVPRVLSIADHLLAGLAHAHEHGVIHRDLKPSNLFETTRGEIKILDFGIASLTKSRGFVGEARRAADASGVAAAISGTPGYMSPEQWLGPEQDARTDV